VRLLLDTHVWVWSLLDPGRLARATASALTDPANELWLSPISVWELLVLIEKRRVVVDKPGREFIEQALLIAPLRDAALSREVALRCRDLALQHNDPADRFLAATALVYDLTLVSADARLLDAPGVRTMRAHD